MRNLWRSVRITHARCLRENARGCVRFSQRRYPKSFRIGYTWSEKVFSGKTLVNEARTIMRCEHVENTGAADTAASSASLQNADESILPEEFSVYLQPKIDMSTGMLLGAEALVRGIDESG